MFWTGERIYHMPQSIVKRLLGEASQDVRFDTNARIEIWVTLDDLEYDRRIEALRQDGRPVEQKIVEAKQIALEVANEKVRNASSGDFEITVDISLESINVDRIDWAALVSPPPPDEDEQGDLEG
jgi:hypothetical protein